MSVASRLGCERPCQDRRDIPDFTKDYVFIDSEEDHYGWNRPRDCARWWEKGYINKTDLTFSGSSQNAQIDYLYPGKASACVENEPNYKWVDQNKQMKLESRCRVARGGYDRHATPGKARASAQLKQWNFIVFNAGAPKEQIEAGIAVLRLAGQQPGQYGSVADGHRWHEL